MVFSHFSFWLPPSRLWRWRPLPSVLGPLLGWDCRLDRLLLHHETTALETVKRRLCQALKHRKEDTVVNNLNQFFRLKHVSTVDCNLLLEACGLHANSEVAHSLWMFMEKKNIQPNTQSVISLLKALCGRGQLDEALKLLYGLGKEINVQPHIGFCCIFLRACSSSRSVSHAEKCLRFIKENGLKEDELVYLALLELGERRKDMQAVLKAWGLLMKSCKPYSPSLESFCSMIKALCKAGLVDEALTAWKEMQQLVSKNEGFLIVERLIPLYGSKEGWDMAYLKELVRIEEDGNEGVEARDVKDGGGGHVKSVDRRPSTMSEGSYGQVYTEKGTQEDCFLSSEWEESSSTCNSNLHTVSDVQQSVEKSTSGTVHATGSAKNRDSEDRSTRVKSLLLHAYNLVMFGALRKGDYQLTEVLFKQMQAYDLTPDLLSYNCMLKAVVKVKGVEQGFQLIKSMEESGLKSDSTTYTAILEGFCVKFELDKAEALLERMLKIGGNQRPSILTFNMLLKACGNADDSLRALRLFAKMVEAKAPPDRGTIMFLLSAFGRVNFPFEQGTPESQYELALRLGAIEAYMEHFNLSHNYLTFNAVLATLSTEGMTDAIFRRMQLAEGRVGSDGLPIINTYTFNIAIHACNRAKQWPSAKDLFKKMQVLGIKPDTVTFNVFINGCAEQRRTGDAFQYMEAMEEVGMQADLITFNSLIKVMCYKKQLDEAIVFLREMETSGVMPNRVTMVTLLHGAVVKDRIDLVEFVLEHMHQRGLQPDITICELVVKAYARCDQVDDAAEALRVLSMRMLPPGRMSTDTEEDILKQVFLEDSSEVEASTTELLKEAMAHKGAVAEALLAARLSGFGNATMGEWNAEESWWAKRVKDRYRSMYTS